MSSPKVSTEDELQYLPRLKLLQVISRNEESTLLKVHQKPDTSTEYACLKVTTSKMMPAAVEQRLKAAMRLVHPLIIKCYWILQRNDAVFALFDYYPLGSVYDLMQKIKPEPLQLEQSRSWFAQILGALSYMHSRGKT